MIKFHRVQIDKEHLSVSPLVNVLLISSLQEPRVHWQIILLRNDSSWKSKQIKIITRVEFTLKNQ